MTWNCVRSFVALGVIGPSVLELSQEPLTVRKHVARQLRFLEAIRSPATESRG